MPIKEDLTQDGTEDTLALKADPTKGDVSEAAATGTVDEVDARMIEFSTPASRNREDTLPQILDIAGESFLEPPEDPESMYQIYRLSAFVEPVIETLETNVYNGGFSLKPTIPFEREEEAKRIIEDALTYEQTTSFDNIPQIPQSEVTKTFKELERRNIVERQFLTQFFEAAVPNMSYKQLWKFTGQDLEVTGNAYWEIIRDTAGRIGRFQWLPSIDVRCTRQDIEQIATEKWIRNSVLSWEKAPQIRRFRRYAQIHTSREMVFRWFKEFGDPRIMSRETGVYYETIEDLLAEEGRRERGQPATMDIDTAQRALAATEVLHFKLPYGGNTAYGKPRWSGSYPGLVGSRELDEENRKLVADESIPSLLLLVSGGTVGAKAYERLREQIKQREKGKKGIMLIEAIAGVKTAIAHPQQQPNISVERLKSEQSSDALFQNYDKRNEDKIDGAFRMPRSILGKDLGQNRATVAAMHRFFEDQIASPKRSDIDTLINQDILSDLGVLTVKYETQSRQPKDPQSVSEILGRLVEAGIMTPNEAREEAGPIFNKRLNDMLGLWANFPPRVMTTLLQTKNKELADILLGNDEAALARLSKATQDMIGLGDTAPIEEGESNEQGQGQPEPTTAAAAAAAAATEPATESTGAESGVEPPAATNEPEV